MNDVVIEAGVEVHRVGGNPLARVRVAANDGGLVGDVADPGISDEPFPIQQQRGILAAE